MKNPSLEFKVHNLLTVQAIDHVLHTEFKDYIYDFRNKLRNINEVPTYDCVVELNRHEEPPGEEIKKRIEELLGQIAEYYSNNN